MKLSMISFSLAMLAGTAFAGDPKAGAPATPPKADASKDAGKPAEMPKPPQEIADFAKAMAGTWNCTGTAEMGGQTGEAKATITHKLDLDGWWIQSSFTGTIAKAPGAFHFTSYTTYDAAKKQWFRTMVNGHGGHAQSWGTHTGNKTTWEGDAHWQGNDVKVRDTEEVVSPKEVHVVGEYSKDGGKTWNKDHDATCKK
jgi:hypothetical protein